MGISQIGNGDFPLNNCAILRQILPETSLDFMKTVLRGEAFANPIADLAGNVRGGIGEALSKIGTLTAPDVAGGSFFGELSNGLNVLEEQLIQFESRTNRMSGVINGFQEGEPDMGRILGIGSAYNSALATLVTNPEDILKDNFSHGFNSLKQEFGINAIQQSQDAVDAAGNFLAQFGLGSTEGGGSFVDPPPFQFYNEAQEILGQFRTIQQSIVNITTAEDAFLAGALAFLDQYALANTALSSVLSDPCMAGKIIGMVASGDLSSLIPDLSLPSLPSLDDILDKVPDPEDIANSIKDSVEGIVESVQEQVQQTIEDVVEIGKETVEAIQKTAEEIVEAGEQLIEEAQQAAEDLAENVQEFGRNVEQFFEDLEKQIEEATSGDEEEDDDLDGDKVGEQLDDAIYTALADGTSVSESYGSAVAIIAPGSRGSGNTNVGSIGSPSPSGYDSTMFSNALRVMKERSGENLGVSNIDRVVSRKLTPSQLSNLQFRRDINGNKFSQFSSENEELFNSYAIEEFGLTSTVDGFQSAGENLSAIASRLEEIIKDPQKYLNGWAAVDRMFNDQELNPNYDNNDPSDPSRLDPNSPNFDAEFAAAIKARDDERARKLKEMEEVKERNRLKREEALERQRKAKEAARQQDLADGRIRPRWVAEHLTDHRHAFKTDLSDKQRAEEEARETGVLPEWAELKLFDLYSGGYMFFSRSFRSVEELESVKEELTKYSRLLGRGLGAGVGTQGDFQAVSRIYSGRKYNEVVPEEMKQVAALYQRGLVSGSNLDIQEAAASIRAVLSVEEIRYYTNMARNMITAGTQGISDLEGIVNALNIAATLPD